MVGKFFCKQYPGERVEKEKVSIFVDKCTVMLFMGVFQGNVKEIFQKSITNHMHDLGRLRH